MVRTMVRTGRLGTLTPLSYAAWRGHEGVAEILLGQGEVNPNKADNDGQTPLMHAAKHGRQGVVELLQRHEAITTAHSQA